jgi:hypothetical protein
MIRFFGRLLLFWSVVEKFEYRAYLLDRIMVGKIHSTSLMISVLSMRIFQTIIKIHIPRFARVVETMVILGQLIHSREIVVCQLALESSVVLRNPLLVAAFRDNAGAAVHAPCQSYLRRRAVALLSNGGDNFVLEQLWRLAGSICRVSARER